MKLYIVIFTSALLFQVGIVLSWDTPRITEPGEFPYIAGIIWQLNNVTTYFTLCSAAILSEFWYLSSAYCVSYVPASGRLFIKAGSHDISVNAQNDQIIAIASAVVHERYPGRAPITGNLAKYDIGLIKGQTALTFNNFVKPIKLCKADTLVKKQKIEYNLLASGWGIFPDNMVNDRPKVMRTIYLSKVKGRVCQDAIQHLFENFNLSDMQMCTRPLDGTIGACIANHGGPLVQYNKHNEPIVVGIVSWSSAACTTNNLARVYIRVSHFVNWINRKIKPEHAA